GIEKAIAEQRPDVVLVYGDTNSTLAGALGAAKCHVPVAHVEAGLRSFDRLMPEEVNRVVADHVADILLCPTESAAKNLADEGIRDGVHVVGDVMYDAFIENSATARASSDVLARNGLAAGGYQLLTVHREDNTATAGNLESILRGVGESGARVVFPAHPRTSALLGATVAVPRNVKVVEPMGYLDMLVLEDGAEAIVTDSGGVQKEAYFAGRPCITVRQNTEWTETVDAGWNVLVGRDPVAIADAMLHFRPSGPRPSVFGDGHAAERVVAALKAFAQRIT
ncbi:MAG TPA: UDP-N-acetylglucosamine 2-epimerase (non-hydrolyzing), partial [Candidatus Dormibacteraeota bacterium]|nr:UDP-N-acetylglucosamine 2-epimerase (non-hydrolyzing) [Candidatus Dormibacteraeota bacterium]